jgi:hypothetical protein
MTSLKAVRTNGRVRWAWVCAWLGAASLVPGLASAVESLPPGLCHLNIVDDRGGSHLCSGVMVSSDRLLTAQHCFRPGFDFLKSVVIAECLDDQGRWQVRDQFDPVLNRPPRSAVDVVMLKLGQPLSLPSFLRLTRYPAMYFSESGELRPQSRCWIYGYRGKMIRLSRHHRFVIDDQSKLRVTLPGGGSSHGVAVPGDSGGPLVCQSSAYFDPEVVAITSTVLTQIDTGRPIGNTFTLVHDL